MRNLFLFCNSHNHHAGLQGDGCWAIHTAWLRAWLECSTFTMGVDCDRINFPQPSWDLRTVVEAPCAWQSWGITQWLLSCVWCSWAPRRWSFLCTLPGCCSCVRSRARCYPQPARPLRLPNLSFDVPSAIGVRCCVDHVVSPIICFQICMAGLRLGTPPVEREG